jgi:transcriptional regulator with GAF, ATPase, and Fis domain
MTLLPEDDRTESTLTHHASERPVQGPQRLLLIGHGKSRQVPLSTLGTLTIGRSPKCDVQLEDSAASRHHAALHVTPHGVEIEDLGSSNGTWAQSKRLETAERVPLEPGKAYRVGNTVLLLSRGHSTDPIAEAAGTTAASDEPVIVSEEMKQLQTMVERVARGDISVLLLGETGAGKEIVARMIHRASQRSNAKFVAVNCPAMPEALLESELFGHQRGAFTGAATNKRGLLEEAAGGTVFLDEVGELPLSVQAKLLRVLEERVVRPVGANDGRPVDVRFVAATNRDLQADIAQGNFRNDLFFRLSGMSLTVPPLRRRPGDVEALARHFLERYATMLGYHGELTLSGRALAQLQGHSWPGNVRELRNVIERAALLCGEGPILPEHLHLQPARTSGPTTTTARNGDSAQAGSAQADSAQADSAQADSAQGDNAVSAQGYDAHSDDEESDDKWSRKTGEIPVPRLAPPPRPMAPTLPPDRQESLRSALDDFEREHILGVLESCGGNQTKAAEQLGISRRGLGKKLDKYDITRPRKG